MLLKRWNVKIYMGVTREPEKINEYLTNHCGIKETLTEIGPFVSRLDALNWLVYIKSSISHFQEIIPSSQSGKNSPWYGFTFEQDNQK